MDNSKRDRQKERRFLQDKYPTRNIIDIEEADMIKALDWVHPLTNNVNMLPKLQEMCEHGFVRFLDKGVILVHHPSADKFISCYPFEFRDGFLFQSIQITNPEKSEEVNGLEVLCKVKVGSDCRYTILGDTYNEKLAVEHINAEQIIQYMDARRSHLNSFIRDVAKAYPNLKQSSMEFQKHVAELYLTSVIKAQIYGVIAINAFLVINDKNLLISQNKQERNFHASDKTEALRHKRSPTYRYKVSLPRGYKPRKFTLNYLVEHWERSGYYAKRWVRAENATTLGGRSGCRVTNETKGDKVAILVPINPATCHRSCAPTKNNQEGLKFYKV